MQGFAACRQIIGVCTPRLVSGLPRFGAHRPAARCIASTRFHGFWAGSIEPTAVEALSRVAVTSVIVVTQGGPNHHTLGLSLPPLGIVI